MKSVTNLFLVSSILISSFAVIDGAHYIIEPNYVVDRIDDVRSLPKRIPLNEQSATVEKLQSFLVSLPPSGPKAEPKAKTARSHGTRATQRVNFHYSGYSPYFDRLGYEDFLNKLDIGATESDDETPRIQDIVNVEAKNNGVIFYAGNEKLQDKLFEAAIKHSAINYERVNQLLDKKKHYLLSGEQRTRLIESMFYNLRDDIVDERIFDLISRLLQEGFFLNINSVYNMKCVLYKQKAIEAFLNYDRNFFANYNYDLLGDLINSEEYRFIEVALAIGYEPTKLHDGLNVLDQVVFSNTSCRLLLKGLRDYVYVSKFADTEYCIPIEDERRNVLRILRAVVGLRESMNFGNFAKSCENYELFPNKAMQILQSGSIVQNSCGEYLQKNNEISPISVAIETGNIALVEKAMELYLNNLTLKQLKNCTNQFSYKKCSSSNSEEYNAHIEAMSERISNRFQALLEE